MKTGMILYVIGPETDSIQLITKDLPIKVNHVEIVSKSMGQHDIHHAHWSLVCKGMQKIICNHAVVDEAGRISLTGNPIRLCG